MISEQEFAEVYLAAQGQVYWFLVRKCRNQDLARDLAQQAWLQAWEHRGAFGQRSTIATWVHRIARNVFLTHLRRRACRPVEVEDALGSKMMVQPNLDTPIDAGKILRLCDPRTERVLRQRYLEDRNFEDIEPRPGGTNLRGRMMVMHAKQRARSALRAAA